jgi:GT2 family glycosyltransferase
MSALVSVLVPCYRDAHLVERALPRLLEGSRCTLEVVLLNNDVNQLERMRDLVVSLGDARVRLLELEHGAGFAKAINTGLAATTGELVFFVNSDLFVADGYLDELVSFFERRPSAGCASGKILRYDLATYRETDVIDTAGLTIGRNRRVADRGENARDVGQFQHEEEVFGVSGAALVARRKALEGVTMAGECLDESFHMYKEDVDLCWRLRLVGWECWYVPSAVAYHGRTVHGLAGKTYLSAPREYHENERSKPRRARTNSMRNQWLMLVKNEDASNLMRDLPYVLGREALVLAFNTFETPRDTVTAVGAFVRALPESIAARRAIKARQTMPPDRMRGWFFAGARRRATQ